MILGLSKIKMFLGAITAILLALGTFWIHHSGYRKGYETRIREEEAAQALIKNSARIKIIETEKQHENLIKALPTDGDCVGVAVSAALDGL